MSVEVEEERTVVQPEEVSCTNISMKQVRSYTREFLLSLSELEACKKLPKGFDELLLSEFHATSYTGAQDRPRVLGSSSLHGFRRTDYGSSPPARGDSGTYSRGSQRWDSRSSGKSEGDSDSESGRRYGNQGRGTWKNSEHDGLLGNGSVPRPPGNAAGGAVQRFRPTENLQLNKSNEPYQPPRPYKTGPHSRRETKDSFNDETFGSSDFTDEERVEEEKKRRAEFELMRKEHHKAFQENQKSNSGKPKDSFAEMVGLLENTSDGKFSSDSNKVLNEAPQDDASNLFDSSQALPTRPLVPPGFVSSVVDKSSVSKSHVHAHALQVENLEVAQGCQNVNSITQESGSGDWFGEISSSSSLKTTTGLSSILHEDGESLVLDSEIIGFEIGEPVRSTSILDKLFDNGLNTACESSSNIVEGDDTKIDDIWCPDKLQSKFTHWFHEEDKTSFGNPSAEKPSSLLSLIIGDEKGRSNGLKGVLNVPIFPGEVLPGQKTSKTASSTGVPKRFGGSNGPLPKASVLTCEDLEQSILSEIGGDNPKFRSVVKEEHVPFEVQKDGLPGTPVDNTASQHLLFLLQGGMSSNSAVSTLGLTERLPDDDKELGKSCLPESSKNTSGARELTHSDRTLTLEALFGTAFMTELHSVQNSGNSGGMDVPDGGLFPTKMGENGDEVGSHEGSILTSNDGIAKFDKVSDWPDSKDNGKKEKLSRLPFETDAKFGGFDGGIGVKLPEEDSLINIVDPINAENSAWGPNVYSCSADLRSLSLNTSGNVMLKLAALGGAVKDERSMVGGPEQLFFHNPYDVRNSEIPYQNPHFNTPPNNSRTLFHPLDSHSAHVDSRMKFLPPEAVHHDVSLHHQFPTNMDHPSFPHSSAGLAPFDHLIPPVLQQMHMAGNPPPHLVRGFPGAAPMAPHPSHTPGFIPEHNPMQGFPFAQRPSNFGGPGMMPPPGPEHGVANNPPEAFQRLLEMELRANPKQMHPFAAGNPSRPMYGHELDMGYRYR